MRNIAIADRKDWVFSHPTPRPRPARSSKLRDALATVPILLLGPALLVPILITSAATPTLRVRPADPNPGAEITITGGGFVAGTTVTFGATPAPATIVDPATLTVVAPPGASGWVDVVVTIPGGSTLSLPGGFTYADEAAPDTTATITITPAGNTPKAVVVAAGGRVRLVNSVVRPHDLESDPHPVHSDSPEANGAGLLVPGASGMTGAFMTSRTCGIDDHNDPGNAAWMSRIVIR